ncbi:MAG: TcfC E-set like domain-containing protein, partial [Gammaproteobacteria bacterium]|nr:TcfC E-set like domain-containing protein [Gammaproteobacteria bacterium]
GFEYLNQPVKTVVDVYYQNAFVMSVPATYTSNTIRFINVKPLVDKIPSIKNPVAIEQALTGDLPTHGALVCPGQPAPGCGILQPKVAGVIFDANHFRVDVFINPSLLSSSPTLNPFLPLSDAGFSAVSHFYGAANGITQTSSGATNQEQNNYGFRAVNDIGSHETMLHSELSYAQNTTNTSLSEFQVNEVDLGHYFDKEYVVRGGVLESQGNTFVGNQTFAGVYLGTTLDTLKTDTSAFGTPLQVFLPTPSYVSIYRDGRLLASQYYPAGNQTLDTSSLPGGAYQVVLQIRDAQGNVTQQTQFFSKTSDIPPLAFPQYYVSMGYLEKNQFAQTTEFPEFMNVPLMQVGYNKRIQSNWGISTGFVGTDEQGFGSAGLFFLEPFYQVNPQLLYGTDKEHGVGLSLQSSVNNFNAGLFGRRIWVPNSNQNATQAISTLEDYNQPINGFITTDQDSTQVNANVGYTLGTVYTALNGQLTKYDDTPSVYAYGPNVRFPIIQNNGTNVDMNFSFTRSSTDWQALAQVIVYFTSPSWVSSGAVGYQKFRDTSGANPSYNDNTGAIANINTYWQQLNAAQEGTILGVSGSTQPGQQAVGFNGNYTAPLGGVQANVQRNTGSTVSPNTQYAASFDTHYAYAGHHAAVGGSNYGDNTGVLIDVESPTPGDKFEVLANDQVVKVVKSGHPTPVFLTPFQTYQIRIKAVSPRFYEYSETPVTVTLYHGNFETLVWHTKQKVVVFGYVQTPDGKMLKNTLINGGVGVNATESDGSAQIEVYNDVQQLEAALPDGKPCTITLPDLKANNNLTVAKQLICQPAGGK